MKIYCQTCKEYVLDTSDKFVIGGPYNGAMFQAPSQSRYHVDAFMFKEWVVHGDLFCPRCEQGFIIAGVILAEHGLIKEGQGSIDTDFSVIHTEGELKNQLMWADKWSREDGFKESEPGGKRAPSVFVCHGCRAGCHSEQKNHIESLGMDVCNACFDNYTKNTEKPQFFGPGIVQMVESIPPPEAPGTFGEMIKEVRETAGLSRSALAKSIGVSASTLKNWEKDKTKPSKKNLKKLKKALNI